MKKKFNKQSGAAFKVMPDGEKQWLLDGKVHREDGPAAIRADGTQIWALYGKRQRKDGGPAVILADGSKFWYRDDLIHRDDGPAVEYANGDKVWYRDGKIHREDGPAMVLEDGSILGWYLNGHLYSSENRFLAAKMSQERRKTAKLERAVRDATVLQTPIKVGAALRLRKCA